MSSIGLFLDQQEKISEKFKNSSVRETGLVPSSDIVAVAKKGSYAIVFRHGQEITDRLGKFSEAIAKIVPAIVYDGDNGHTTIVTTTLFDEFNPEREVLKKLAAGYQTLHSQFAGTEIDYCSWLCNENTVIAKGNPNDVFIHGVLEAKDYDFRVEVALRGARGSHITASRFKEPKTMEELTDFFRLMDEGQPLGMSRPVAVDVGHFHVSSDGFVFKTYERFDLK